MHHTSFALRAVAACGALAVVALLSACATEAPAPAKTVFVTVEPTLTPTPTPSAPAAPPPVAEEPPVDVEIEPNAPAAPVVPGPAFDHGAVSGAMGATTSDGNGALLTYTVASGDAFFDIAQRFDLPQQQLLKMNPSIPSLGTEIYIGQVINIDWTTTR